MIERIGRALPGRRARKPAGVPPAPGDWRVTMRKRAVVVVSLLACWVVGIEARLVYLQVFEHARLVKRAERQQSQTIALAAKRGDIVDRRGHVLATSVDADTVYAIPSSIGDEGDGPAKRDVARRDVVDKLCEVFGDCTNSERQGLLDRLQKQRNFAYIRRQVSPDDAQRIKALKLEGVGFVKEGRRYYPNKELVSHVLGFVGRDNRGLGGIESSYDSQIRGKDGSILVHTDAKRQAFNRFERPPTSGSTIELTIDEYLQHIAERELHAGVVENRAVGGTALILDPRTGEILAMANEPTFNPNVYREFSETDRRNRAVQNLYEPGSTFKVVTASAAVEEKLMPIDTPIDVHGGQIRIGSRVVSDTHPHESLSFTDVIVQSSNVGAIKIGLRLGADRLSDYVTRFGFGRRIAPDFPSESPGIVWDRTKWTDSALASVSMGYQIGVTPLQMAVAVSAIANGGEYVEPRVVRATYHDDRRFGVRSKVVRRTISAESAATLTTIMEQVVERGTAKPAQIPGFTIAGKTGTANTLVNGRYTNATYASFVGFLPSRDPKVTILVMLEAPHGANGHFGGPVSGPIFKRIAEATLRYLGVPPSINPAPPVIVARHSDDGPVATSTAANEAPAVGVVTVPAGTVPDVRGMSARDAMRTLARAGVSARMSGDGFVVSQDPGPGEPLGDGGACAIVLERAPAHRLAMVAER